MFRLALAQIVARRGRSSALFFAVIFAVSGFTILTGVRATSKLQVTDLVSATAKSNYDILVRPSGSRDQTETAQALVRPNYLNGQYGGITFAQLEGIGTIPNVEVAAPIATIGYVPIVRTATVDLTAELDSAQIRQVFRVKPSWSGDSGLSRGVETTSRFVYVTRRPVAAALQGPDSDGFVAPDGRITTGEDLAKLQCIVPYFFFEYTEDNQWTPLCGTWFMKLNPQTQMLDLNAAEFRVYQNVGDGRFLDFKHVIDEGLAKTGRGDRSKPETVERITADVMWPIWLPIAGIDPAAEAELAGLDRALVSGSFLPQTLPQPGKGEVGLTIPVIVANRTDIDEALTLTTERLASASIAGQPAFDLLQRLETAPGTAKKEVIIRVSDVYNSMVSSLDQNIRLDVGLASAAPSYTVRGSTLTPQPVAGDPNLWQTDVSLYGELARGPSALEPFFAADTPYRKLMTTSMRKIDGDLLDPPHTKTFGLFDPSRIMKYSDLTSVPMETYFAPVVTGGDWQSRQALKDGPLRPANSPSSYLVSPPAILTSMDAVKHLVRGSDPISAVRVRVADVSGIDPVSRERVRLVAEEIAKRTGLDVDITLGSSIQNREVTLPAGMFGRPELALLEGWAKKGVAVGIVKAADRKNLVLAALILIACLMFLLNSIAASVHGRRREIALLAALGWPAWRRAGLIIMETGSIGLLAGACGWLTARPLGHLLNVDLNYRDAVVAVPASALLAIVGAIIPAVRAARTRPATGMVQTASPRYLSMRVKGKTGLAVANLLRTPSRAVIASSSLAISVAGAVLVLAAMLQFRSTIVGTLLGDAVTFRVQTSDLIALAAIAALGAGAIADAVYLGIHERASDFATIRAVGWSNADIRHLIVIETVAIGSIGSLIGVTVGLLCAAAFIGAVTPTLIAAGGIALSAGLLLAAVSSVVPAMLQNRLPVAVLQAEG